MKVHEYQAKEILSRYGVPVPGGGVASNTQKAHIYGRAGRGHRPAASSPCVVVGQSPPIGSTSPLEQPKRLRLRLFRLALVRRSLRRFLPPLALAPGRGSGPLVGRELGFVLPPGLGPLDHPRDL